MPNDLKEQDKAKSDQVDEQNQPKTREQQQKSDPQLTELKGFTDPDEDLEPKGTDSPVSEKD